MAITVLVFSAILIVMLTVAVHLLKRQTLFFPMKYPDGEWDRHRFDPVPRDVEITSDAGIRLHAWLFASAIDGAPILIWHHGNGGNLTHRAEAASALARQGVSVVVFDYRGYGKSEGTPSESDLYEDALLVYDYVMANRLAPRDRIFTYGESLGGPYAAYVAWKRPVRGVVIENSFHSAGDVATRLYRVPIGLLLANSLSTADYLNKADVPVLVMHGRRDSVIPIGSGLRLYESIRVPKELWLSETADHSELSLDPEYYERVTAFVRKVVGEG